MTIETAPTVAIASPALRRKVEPSVPMRGYLPMLDGWRAIAVVLVLIDHAISRRANILTGTGLHYFRSEIKIPLRWGCGIGGLRACYPHLFSWME